jgi:hypothetical protein
MSNRYMRFLVRFFDKFMVYTVNIFINLLYLGLAYLILHCKFYSPYQGYTTPIWYIIF